LVETAQHLAEGEGSTAWLGIFTLSRPEFSEFSVRFDPTLFKPEEVRELRRAFSMMHLRGCAYTDGRFAWGAL
jgi:hypothetical protein